MLRFNLVDLRLFLHVVDQGTITSGATRAHLSLAAASARLAGMEATLGVPLVTRGRRGVTPTPAGRSLAHHARLVLDQMARMHGELREHARGLRGHVRLLGNTAAMAEYLPDILGGFLARHPTIDVTADEMRSELIVRAIAEGRADLGIVANSAPRGELKSFPLREDRLVVVVAPKHPLARRRRMRFRELLGCDFVGLAGGSALRAHLDRQAAPGGRALHYRVTFRSFEAVARTVAHGAGLAIVPASVAERCGPALGLVTVALQDRWANRRLLVVVRDRAGLPEPARRLLEAMVAARPTSLSSPIRPSDPVPLPERSARRCLNH